ncbi:MAG TPA: glycosyltransferase, partial [Pirellulales bacterium]
IQRKGFDLVLDAYLAEFTPADDVCLVVKDVGAATFYRGASFRDAILAAAADPTQPAIVYLDDEMTEEQIAGLYRACHCLTAPYRGEGFGLPILEAMACGLPPIVPRGGPTDDFVPAEAGYFLETRTIETQHPWALVGPAQELLASATELRRVMRRVYSSPAETRARGEKAAESAKRMTWAATAAMMRARMAAICRPAEFGLRSVAAEAASQAATPPSATVSSASSPELVLAACLRIDGRDEDLPRRLCELRLMFDRTVVLAPPTSRAAAIAAEYEAHVLPLVDSESDVDALRRCAGRIAADWCVFVPASLELSPNAVDVLRSALRSCGNESAEVRLTDGGQAFWVWRGLGPCGPAAPQWDSAWNSFKSRLGKRALGFHAMFQRLDRLDRPEVTIVETGCVRGEGDWGAGQSTILFDSYVAHRGGRVVSVDVDAANCRHARGRVGAQTRVVEGDSVKFLRELAKSEPQSVDLLYLDSFDLDWNSPHESALHHLQELCAALPALRPGATVFIDDHCDELGRLGKSLYVLEFMRRIRASVVYEGYQIGWTLDDS